MSTSDSGSRSTDISLLLGIAPLCVLAGMLASGTVLLVVIRVFGLPEYGSGGQLAILGDQGAGPFFARIGPVLAFNGAAIGLFLLGRAQLRKQLTFITFSRFWWNLLLPAFYIAGVLGSVLGYVFTYVL
jgi:hypothetical protein